MDDGGYAITQPINVTTYEYTLVNGTTINSTGLFQKDYRDHSDLQDAHFASGGTLEANGYERPYIEFRPPTSDYNELILVDNRDFSDSFTEIENQKQSVHSEVETFIANTYDEYQVGEIDNKDLIDPYLGNREYSPQGDYKNWALRSLQNTGLIRSCVSFYRY